MNKSQDANAKILIAGIGNLLLTDEGVGVHIIRELSKRKLPENVELVDIGTASFDLLTFMEGKDKVIIIDAIAVDDKPGALYKLSPDDIVSGKQKLLTSLHQFGIPEVLSSIKQKGEKIEIVIFGIVPKDYQTYGTELTPELKTSLPKVIKEILKEIGEEKRPG
jgi:hydrogenase maturation protease